MELSAASGQWNYYIAASIMSVMDYHILVDLYGTIPYSEGLQGDKNTSPKWEDGKAVNVKLIAQLDEAIAKKADASAASKMGAEDMIFQGDVNQWIKFAKTLKLKILMRDFTANQAAIQTLLTENDFLDTRDAKMTGFIDSENKSNPFYEYDRRKLNTFFNVKASNTLLNKLKNVNPLDTSKVDPRLANYFEPTVTGTYFAFAQGDYTITGLQTNQTSRLVSAATDPVYFASAAESKFLQAEAWARIGNIENAKLNYNAGVTLAFERWSKDASAFIAAGGPYEFTAGNTEQMIKTIITQKWLAAVRCQAWDSFFDQNRTGYPAISTFSSTSPGYVIGDYTISVNTSLIAGEVPRRLLIPKVSADNNPNTPAAVPINTKMWWHKQ